jgi:hypothetical protein
MSLEKTLRPIFFSIRKNVSYFTWGTFGDFFDFRSVCIEPLGEDSFTVYAGDCLKVQRLGRKYLVSAARYRKLRNGIYILVEERNGKYVFQLIRPLRRKA